MAKNPHIRAVEGEQSATAAAETSVTAEQVLPTEKEYIPEEDWYEEPAPRRASTWILPTLALVAVAAWSGFFGWANRAEMLAGAPPQQWIGWITAWATPVLLVVRSIGYDQPRAQPGARVPRNADPRTRLPWQDRHRAPV
jgi:hypothetical protein